MICLQSAGNLRFVEHFVQAKPNSRLLAVTQPFELGRKLDEGAAGRLINDRVYAVGAPAVGLYASGSADVAFRSHHIQRA